LQIDQNNILKIV